MAGMTSATTASSSISDCALAAVRSKNWRSRLRPPTSIAAPMTSRMLPRIDPTSEALTTSWSPSFSAKKAMISSGALPKVTLRKPPMPGPDRAASSSVARPMSAAVGMTPSAEVTKISVALACANSSAIATAMNGTSRYGQPSPLKRNRRRLNDSRAWLTARDYGLRVRQEIRALADRLVVVTGLLHALRVLPDVRLARTRIAATGSGPELPEVAEAEALELLEQLVERPRLARRLDLLVLVDLLELEVEPHVHRV